MYIAQAKAAPNIIYFIKLLIIKKFLNVNYLVFYKYYLNYE